MASGESWSSALAQATGDVSSVTSPTESQQAAPERLQAHGATTNGDAQETSNARGGAAEKAADHGDGAGAAGLKHKGEAPVHQTEAGTATTSTLRRKHECQGQPLVGLAAGSAQAVSQSSPVRGEARTGVRTAGTHTAVTHTDEAAAQELADDGAALLNGQAGAPGTTDDPATAANPGAKKIFDASPEVKAGAVSAQESQAAAAPLTGPIMPPAITATSPGANPQAVGMHRADSLPHQPAIAAAPEKRLLSDNAALPDSGNPATPNDKTILASTAASGSGGMIIAGVGAGAASAATSANASLSSSATASTASTVPAADGAVAATPAALAASITAMHKSGQISTVLRLDPPGLGALSVHIAVGQSAQVNVQFIPTVAQTAQLLNNSLVDLRQAMAAAGLTLGQTQVSGGGQGGGTASNGNGQGGRSQSETRSIGASTSQPVESGPAGVRAYA
ncbi:MAG TPA: flagellar hook-length control protein FliK [Acidocella sp.]|nr:flagellar hook-length control protein FliK [Acidocella sp.]